MNAHKGKILTLCLGFLFQFQGLAMGTAEGSQYRQEYARFVFNGLKRANQCESSITRPRFRTKEEEQDFLRSMLAHTQYVFLNKVIDLLPKLFKKYGLSQKEYETFQDQLIGRYCSPNITTISHLRLKELGIKSFGQDNDKSLPGLYFKTKSLDEVKKTLNSRDSLKKILKYATELFIDLCSWDGNSTQNNILAWYLQDSFLGEYILYDLLFENPKKVVCQHKLCRPQKITVFDGHYPKMIREGSWVEQFESTWCFYYRRPLMSLKDVKNEFLRARLYKKKNLRLNKSILFSFLTRMPAYKVAISNDDLMDKVLFNEIQIMMEKWANRAIDDFKTTGLFQERLEYSVLGNDLRSYERYRSMVEINISYGELDKAVTRWPKLTLGFDLDFQGAYLKWLKNKWKLANRIGGVEKLREQVLYDIETRVRSQLKQTNKVFYNSPLEQELAGKIALEILKNLAYYQGNEFERAPLEKFPTKVYLHMGLFAMRYQSEKFGQLLFND